MMSPVIDLDAALGPFNTPEMASDRVVNSGFSAATKRMYSGGRRGEFVGPEMRYHRRAESAPEMPHFDRSAVRFGGTSTLANPDVFYEEEEDAFLAGNEVSKPELDTVSVTHPSVIPDSVENESFGSGSSATVTREDSNAQALQFGDCEPHTQVVDSVDSPDLIDTSAEGVLGNVADNHSTIPQDRIVGEIIVTSEPSNFDPVSRNSIEIVEVDDNSVAQYGKLTSPNLSTGPIYVENCPASSQDDIGHIHPHATLSQEIPQCPSNFPSPDPSSLSFEVPRLATASSSMTDRNTLHSMYSSEPVIGYPQGSIEDVPSLTSSASTMTGNMPHYSPFYTCVSADRVGSFSAAIPRRASEPNTHKRSSLSSLSKLVGGATGQKSKLRHEEKAPGADTVKIKKRGHRMSRLMHFWKSKEKQKGTGD